jgi:hypothetical protein
MQERLTTTFTFLIASAIMPGIYTWQHRHHFLKTNDHVTLHLHFRVRGMVRLALLFKKTFSNYNLYNNEKG